MFTLLYRWLKGGMPLFHQYQPLSTGFDFQYGTIELCADSKNEQVWFAVPTQLAFGFNLLAGAAYFNTIQSPKINQSESQSAC